MDAWSEGLRRAAVGSAAIQILTFNHICADLPPPRANARTQKKSMGGHSEQFCIFLNLCLIRRLEITFNGLTTFRLVSKLPRWSQNALLALKVLLDKKDKRQKEKQDKKTPRFQFYFKIFTKWNYLALGNTPPCFFFS